MSDDLTPRFPGGKWRYHQFMAITGRYAKPVFIAYLVATFLAYLFAFLVQDFTRSAAIADGPRASGPPPAEAMESGRAAFDRGDLRRARDILLPLAEAGFPDAQTLVGSAFLDSRAGRPDRCEAAKWFDRAARQGNRGAQWELARAYRLGKGIPQDVEKAYLWGHWAHRGGPPPAISELSLINQEIAEHDRKRLDAILASWSPDQEPPARIVRIPNIPLLTEATWRVIGVGACRPWFW